MVVPFNAKCNIFVVKTSNLMISHHWFAEYLMVQSGLSVLKTNLVPIGSGVKVDNKRFTLFCILSLLSKPQI